MSYREQSPKYISKSEGNSIRNIVNVSKKKKKVDVDIDTDIYRYTLTHANFTRVTYKID